jgi:3-carboxy-cis,cis-muconate cycloisomerase
VLLAQTEVGEVAESEPGGSSSMPHKRNPAAAVLARACARLVHANAGLLTSGEYEHERAAGAWQAEWPALSAALAFTGGAAAAARRSLEGLRVDAEAMAENVAEDDTGAAEALVDRALARYRNEPT